MNEASKLPAADSLVVEAELDAEPDQTSRLGLYFSVGLGAGAVIALQIDVMRVFSVGSWAHFGSLVVSLAMLGFGLASATMTVAKDWFARHWRAAATVSLALFGPLAVAANLYVQHLGFNAIFLVSDPAQKWKLLQIFLAELTPFLAGAFFLGCVFLRSNRTFGRVYFADLAGAGLCGLVSLLAMYVFTPANLIAAPLALWFAACFAWAFGPGGRRALVPFHCRRRLGVRWPFRRAADVWPQDARDRTTTRASLMRANSRTRKRSTRARPHSAFSRPIRVLICILRPAYLTMPASACRRCRSTRILASISMATGRSASCAI